MAFDRIATVSLWEAVRQDNPEKIRALVRRGADVRVQGQMRVIDNRGRTGKDSLLDEAIVHRSLHALETLLELGAPFRPTKERGSEFTRACAQTAPWMEGLERMFALRPSLQAISHRDKEGFGAIHDALSYTSAFTAPDEGQDCSALVRLLLTRPGKWTPSDTGIAVGVCMCKGYQVSILDRLESVGVPVAGHLATPAGAQRMWSQVNMNTMGTRRWNEWLDALMARDAVGPDSASDPHFLALVRQAKARRSDGLAAALPVRPRARP